MRPLFAIFVVLTAATLVSAGATPRRGKRKLLEIQPIFVEKPFATQKALNAFRNYVAQVSFETGSNIQIPAEFYTAAPLITYWGYEFQENASGKYDVVFTQKFDASSLFAALVSFVGGLREDNCSNWHVTGVRVTAIAAKEIDVAGGVEGTEMACTHVLFDGDAKTKVGDIGGSATGRLTFHVDSSGDSKARYRGAFLADDPKVSAYGKAKSIFGINSDSVLGQVVISLSNLAITPIAFVRNPTDFSVWDSINIFNGHLWRAPSAAMNDVVFAISEHGVMKSTRYREFLADVTEITWSIQQQFLISDARSGFAGTAQAPTLEVSFTTTVKPDFPIETIEADISREIETLKSFAKDEKTIVVKKGQNFWKLSQQTYGTPYYFNMLAAANGRSRAHAYRIWESEKIKAPPLYALPLTQHVHFMKPGETIYGLCLEKFRPPVDKCMSAFARANPKLPLSHLYALEPINIPSLASR